MKNAVKQEAGKWFEIIDVPVSELTIDEQIQRERMNEAKVRKIVAEFNPDALHVITVSDRGLNEKIILDGWHRTEAQRRVSGGAGAMRSVVWHGLDHKDEATLFLLLNSGNKPSLFDQFRVGVEGGQEEYIRINDVVRQSGLSVGPKQSAGAIHAVMALKRLYAMQFSYHDDDEVVEPSSTVLGVTLRAIVDAWGIDAEGLHGALLEGVGRLLQRNGRIELDRLVDAMKNYPGGPTALYGSARAYAQTRRIQVWQAVAQLLIDRYNMYLQKASGRLLPAITNK